MTGQNEDILRRISLFQTLMYNINGRGQENNVYLYSYLNETLPKLINDYQSFTTQPILRITLELNLFFKLLSSLAPDEDDGMLTKAYFKLLHILIDTDQDMLEDYQKFFIDHHTHSSHYNQNLKSIAEVLKKMHGLKRDIEDPRIKWLALYGIYIATGDINLLSTIEQDQSVIKSLIEIELQKNE